MAELSFVEQYYVNDITEINSKKRLIHLNYEKAFSLYLGEIRKFNIKNNTVMPNAIYQEIVQEILPKRAKMRVMNLLKTHDMTEYELKHKLMDGYYPDSIIDSAIDYVKQYGYVDDRRYAENYLLFHSVNKSRMQVIHCLQKKGIDNDIISNLYNEYYTENNDVELSQIIKLVNKKKVDILNINSKEKSKLLGYLTRRGFRYDTISKALDVIINNTSNLE